VGTLISETIGTAPFGAVPVGPAPGSGFVVTQFAPILAPTGGGVPILLGNPTGPVAVGSGAAGRGGVVAGGGGPTGQGAGGGGPVAGMSNPGGSSGIVPQIGAGLAAIGQSAGGLDWGHILLAILLIAGLWFLWPRLSSTAGRAIKGAR
jgi:hypothetical protein